MIPGLDEAASRELDELLAELLAELPEAEAEQPQAAATPSASEVPRAAPPRGATDAMTELERRCRAQLKPQPPALTGKPSPLQKDGGPLSWMV